MNPIRIATRNSPLAMWQAEHVAARLKNRGFETELVPLVSGGDTDMRPIDGTRQVGVFTKRIQQALLDREADVAVHSLKDLPTEADDRFFLAAVPPRETVCDSLVSPKQWDLESLPQGARIGTGSRRRAAQLLSRRPDLKILPIRGNVQTRLAKLESGEYDAILLAEAGVVRLEMHDLTRTQFPLDEMLPAPGQGALGIEVRSKDPVCEAVSTLDDPHTRAAVTAERQLLASLHGGCLAPIAALAVADDSKIRLDAVVLSHDGKTRLDEHHETSFPLGESLAAAGNVAETVSRSLTERGAEALIQSQR